jgi:hypothetical protein
LVGEDDDDAIIGAREVDTSNELKRDGEEHSLR